MFIWYKVHVCWGMRNVVKSGDDGNKRMQYNSKSIIVLNWKAEAFVKIFLIKITDYYIRQNFALSNIYAIRYSYISKVCFI